MSKRITARDKEKAQEASIAVLKGALGLLPGGGIAAELLGTVIPNRRLERIEKMLVIFIARVEHIAPEMLHKKMHEPEFVNLFEQGAYQVAKAMAEARIEMVGNLLGSAAEKSSDDQVPNLYMSILDELSDLDLVVFLRLCKTFMEAALKSNLEPGFDFEDITESQKMHIRYKGGEWSTILFQDITSDYFGNLPDLFSKEIDSSYKSQQKLASTKHHRIEQGKRSVEKLMTFGLVTEVNGIDNYIINTEKTYSVSLNGYSFYKYIFHG